MTHRGGIYFWKTIPLAHLFLCSAPTTPPPHHPSSLPPYHHTPPPFQQPYHPTTLPYHHTNPIPIYHRPTIPYHHTTTPPPHLPTILPALYQSNTIPHENIKQGLLPLRFICYQSTHLTHRCMLKHTTNINSLHLFHLFHSTSLQLVCDHLSHRPLRHLFISCSLTSSLICSCGLSVGSSVVSLSSSSLATQLQPEHYIIASPSPLLFVACYDLNTTTTTITMHSNLSSFISLHVPF